MKNAPNDDAALFCELPKRSTFMFECLNGQVCWVVSRNNDHSLIFSKAINNKTASGDVEARRDDAIVVNATPFGKGHDKGNILNGI